MSDRCNFKMFTDRGYHFKFKFYIKTALDRRKSNCSDSYLKVFEGSTNNDLLLEHCGDKNEIIESKSSRVNLKYKRGSEAELKITYSVD